MIHNLYSIYDTVAEIFNKPFTAINDGDARRSFEASIKDITQKNDYVLYHIGAHNDNDGTLQANKVPVKIVSGVEFKTDNVVNIGE